MTQDREDGSLVAERKSLRRKIVELGLVNYLLKAASAFKQIVHPAEFKIFSP